MRSRFSNKAAISIVVANMIGTGVFTSLGFQLLDITSPFVLIMLWVVGGVTALCGALTYADYGDNEINNGSPIWGTVSGEYSAHRIIFFGMNVSWN